MRSGFIWLTLVAFALLFGGTLLLEQQSQRGSLQAEHSTYRSDERGAKALFLTLENLGLRPRRWEADFARLPARGLLFIIAPPETRPFFQQGDILPHEVKALDDWVRSGNTVVVLSDRKNPLYEALEVFTSVPVRPVTISPAQPGRLARGVKNLEFQSARAFRFGKEAPRRTLLDLVEQLEVPSSIPPVKEQAWLPLFGTRSDPAVIATTHGEGQYVLVADVYPASNLGLVRASNLEFMVNLASLAHDREILFDEAHHRNISRGFVAYARAGPAGGYPLTPFLLYALFVAAVVIWRSGVRFGAPLPLVPDPRRDSAEYVRAVASLYQSAGMAHDSLAAAYEQFRRHASGWLRLGREWNPDLVARRFAARTGQPTQELWQVLNDVEAALTRPRLSEAEAFALTSRLAAWESRLNRQSALKGARKTRRGTGRED